MTGSSERMVCVFVAGEESGGNRAPVVVDARGMDDAAMLAIARRHGLESAFVLPPGDARNARFRLRFFMPTGEVAMCGHATLGALWLLGSTGVLPAGDVRIETASGIVVGRVPRAGTDDVVEVTQPAGTITPLAAVDATSVLSTLRLDAAACLPWPLLDASTSRPKTLVPLRSPAAVHALAPDFSSIAACCDRTGSTGLYPFAPVDGAARVFEARQFPRASGYPEDAATGIAASALAFGLLHWGAIPPDAPGITVRQGRAMGCPSEILVRFERAADGTPTGCRVGGRVRAA
jgi:PhzF family phenazine biosynthesis protein